MKFTTRVLDFFRNLIRIAQLDKVLRAFTRDRKYNSLIGILVPRNYQYTRSTSKKIIYNGIHFEVDIHDYCGHFFYYRFEDTSQTTLFSLCKSGDTVIDIGTNIGFSLLNMAKIIGSDGLVIGFEPDPANFIQLEKNISLNDFTNLKVNKKGLGDKPGKFKLENRIESNSGMKRIGSSVDYVEVEIDTLDNFISASNNSLPKIDLIKIDVEGFELNVLKGALNTIRKYYPVLFIEVDDNNLRDESASARELIHFIAENDYEMVNAENKMIVKEEDYFRNCHYDIICRKKLHTSSPT